jgi:hypothetical protein
MNQRKKKRERGNYVILEPGFSLVLCSSFFLIEGEIEILKKGSGCLYIFLGNVIELNN